MTGLFQSIDLYAHTNPAFVGLISFWATKGYCDKCSKLSHETEGLLFPFAMVAAAWVAPAQARGMLPANANKKLTIFISENHMLRSLGTHALRAWREPFWEGARLASAAGLMRFNGLRLLPVPKVSLDKAPTGEQKAMKKAATLVGTMFAKQGNERDLATALGIGVGT